MKYEKAYVALLLTIFAVLAISSMAQKGLTTDELAHIPAGYSYIKTQDFRLNPEHPALMKSLAGLFLLPLNPTLPLEHNSWITARGDGKQQWIFGAQFLHIVNDLDSILFWARIPVVLLALLLGFYIWRWSKELYGSKPALFALTLFTFSPNLLAHSRLVTTDLAITTFSLITIYYWYHALQNPSTRNLIKTGVALGLALASKFTGVYLPIILVLQAVWLSTKAQQEDVKRFAKQTLTRLLIVGATAFGTLILAYQIVGIPDFFVGLWRVIVHSQLGHNAYLMGAYSKSGWWYYFIFTFLFKTPIAIFILIIARMIYKHTKPFDKQTGFILLPAAIFFISFMLNKINIGHRHILPIYPFLFIWLSPLANTKDFAKKTLLVFTIVFYIVSSLFIYPHYLAYFNEFITPEQGHNYLLDSNIDWGQDLKGLGVWTKENNIDNITMAYFGLDYRDYRGITWNELKCRPTSGLIAISVNRLKGLNPKDAKCTAWMKDLKPIHYIGYSIHIYNISKEQIIPIQDNFCREQCTIQCTKEDLALANSFYNTTCKCACF